MQRLVEQKLLALTCGPVSIRFRPHLAVTADEIDGCLARIEAALADFCP